jgi:hypothetical protein
VQFQETVEADAVVLRRWRHEFAKEAAAAVQASLPSSCRSCPGLMRGTTPRRPAPSSDSSDVGWAEGKQWNYALFDRSGVLVGSCGLHDRVGPVRSRSATGCTPTTRGAATRRWPRRRSPTPPSPNPGSSIGARLPRSRGLLGDPAGRARSHLCGTHPRARACATALPNRGFLDHLPVRHTSVDSYRRMDPMGLSWTHPDRPETARTPHSPMLN